MRGLSLLEQYSRNDDTNSLHHTLQRVICGFSTGHLRRKTSYRQISWSLEATRFDDRIILQFDKHLDSATA